MKAGFRYGKNAKGSNNDRLSDNQRPIGPDAPHQMVGKIKPAT